jgi:hypothetical protein
MMGGAFCLVSVIVGKVEAGNQNPDRFDTELENI